MTILCNELTLEQVNAALLRIQRSIQSNTNNFQNDVEKAVANVTVNSKNTVQKYDDTVLRNLISELQKQFKEWRSVTIENTSDITKLETILANIDFRYDETTKEITFVLGDYTKTLQLIDTTYTFSYDDETGTFAIVDNVTGETVFSEIFNDTTYTFSFTNGVLTVHNNLTEADQTFNFDDRYYTESEIQSLILDKIPTQASASNQLADKEFVNSSISTATATFRGTVTTTQALAALTGDLNDYAFLENIDSTTGQVESYDRYKWVESGGDYGHWKYEYTLNNSSFTAAQWDAINSGITCQIVTDLLDGCYTGHGSQVAKSTANEWKSILATNCDCSSAVDADCIYYNTNIQANQACGSLKAKCYCIDGKGYAKFAKSGLSASDLGLTAGCCYPLTCILNQIMVCYGSASGTYTFIYSNACNPIICETLGYAYCGIFTKEDSFNPIAYNWNMTRWSVSFNNGLRFNASAYSTANAGIACWNVSNNARASYVLRNQATSGTCHIVLTNDKTEGYSSFYASNGCPLTFDPSTGTLAADNFSGAIDETKYPGACCTGTLVPSDLNDYQKKNIPSAITLNATANLTCVDTILSCFNNTIQKQAKRKTFTSAHCRYIYLANIAVSTGSVSSTSFDIYVFSNMYDACSTKAYTVGTIHLEISSGSNANGFSIRGYSDIRLDCTTSSYPRIIVTKDTTAGLYCLYLDSGYTYLAFDIQRNKGFGTNAWGTLCACAAVSGTEIFNSSTSDDIKYIGGLVSISDKAAVDEPTPVLLCTGVTNAGKSTSCALTFNTCTGDLSANKFIGSNQYHGVLGSASGSTVKYATIEIDGTSYQYFETCINFSIYNSVFHAVSLVCDSEIRGLANVWYEGDNCYGIKCIGYSTCKANNTCIYVAYTGYRFVNISSSARIKSITQNGATEPTNVCWIAPAAGIPLSQRACGAARVDRTKLTDSTNYPFLLAACSETTQNGSVYTADGICYNPGTGILSVAKGTCIGWNRTASCYIEVTPTAQSSCWIYIGAFQPNGTSGATKQYNELNLTFAAIGSGMVSSATIKLAAASAINPTVTICQQCGYSDSTGIDYVLVTRSGSVWNCSLCVWARVKSSGTCKYYFHLFRNMLPDGWSTALTVCSSYTGTIVARNNVGINTRAIQTNANLRVGDIICCTSSQGGSNGSIYGQGYMELYATTPFIDFHRNHFCGDYSARIINDDNRLLFCINNGVGCTACTQTAAYMFCSNGNAVLPYSIVGCGGRLLNCLFTKADNSGYPTYRLLYEVTDWYNAAGTSSSNVGGRGLVGTFTHFRCAGYTTTATTQVTAVVSYGKGNQADACCISNVIQLTYADLGYAGASTVPYILKDTTNSKYYIAIRTTSSGHNYIFSGCAYSSSGTGFTVSCEICATDASGTLPSGWSAITAGARRQCANFIYAACISTDGLYPLLMAGNENAWTCLYTNCSKLKANPNNGRIVSCQSRINDYILVGNAETATTGTINPTEGGILLCKSQSGKMLQLNGNIGTDVGLLLYHCGDATGTTYCNIGIEIGSGNINRGFYHCCAGSFQWLQYWDASKEIHNCPICFNQCVNGSSSFSGTTAMFNNTNRLGSVYSSSTYSTGYYLLAQICDGGAAGNHDIYLGGYLDSFAVPRMTWKGVIRANKCTLSFACFFVDNDFANNCLVATREIDTTTCKLVLRIYGKVSANYQRFNTTITYAAIGDCNNRVSPYHSCVTLPGTYVTSVTGTTITTTQNIGSVSSDGYCTIPVSRTCSFPATSTSYILLGCYQPGNNTYDNELDLGFAIGGGNLVEKVKLNLMLVNGSCCSTSFRQNKIQVRNADYQTGCYGVRCIAFTTSGSSWNCCIGVWAVVCNPSSSACSWCFGLLRNRIDDRWSTCMSCTSTAPTFVCKVEIPSGRKNFTFDNSWYSCFCEIQTPTVGACKFLTLGCEKTGYNNYVHLGCYSPTLLCTNDLDLTISLGDAGGYSANIKALLSTGCYDEFGKNNIQIKTSGINNTNACIDSIVFSTIGTCWSCSIDIWAKICSSSAVPVAVYQNNANTNFIFSLCCAASLPPSPLSCFIPINSENTWYNNATANINQYTYETSATDTRCASYRTLVIGNVNCVRKPTHQKIFVTTSITGSENPLNMWIEYMGGYGDKDFLQGCFSGGNCNVIVPMRLSSDSENIYIDFATCDDVSRTMTSTIYSSGNMPLGSLGNAVRTYKYTSCLLNEADSYCYAMCQWSTTIIFNVDDPSSQIATRVLSANTLAAQCVATTSDVRQKKDIIPYNNGLCDISNLDIISFRYKYEDENSIKHISVPANWTNQLISGEKQNQLRVNDTIGILLSAVKDLSNSMTLGQKIKLWLYKKFIEPKNNKKIQKKLKDFN